MNETIAARTLSKNAGLIDPKTCKTSCRLAILGYRSTPFLARFIKEAGLIAGVKIELYEAGYDQVELAVFNPDSDFYKFNPQFVLIVNSLGKLRNQFYDTSLEEKKLFSPKILNTWSLLAQTILSKSSPQIFITNLEETPDGVFGNFSNKTRLSFSNQIRRLNTGLMDMAEAESNLHILDVSAIASLLGADKFLDSGLYVNADIPYTLDTEAKIATEFVVMLQAFMGKIRKCLIIDLDNTIWGGTVGDDGIEGIILSTTGPGKAFKELQKWIKQLKERGIILAVCSKNEENLAKEVFSKHESMILSLEDIAVFLANWNNKADNIRHIQQVLNIGFDAMVFIDDNPAERTLVRDSLPEVLVPDLPTDPAHFLPFLSRLNLFETPTFSSDDPARTLLYQEEAQRRSMAQEYTDIDSFLKSLEMKGQISPFQDNHIARIAQLSQRSNQFNLRTLRYSEAEVKKIQSASEYLHYEVSLADKLGDYGLISVVVMRKIGEHDLFIENWLMSCRVMQRGVEKFVLNCLVRAARERGFHRLIGEYLSTAKNTPVENHYPQLGFTQNEKDLWELSLSTFAPLPHYIAEDSFKE
ncbi:MAG: HAD-IIIC family phosphatase [Bacteroidia bacterium]|nr:HAD-IIIC family phosphatase [Bacteroidia bacterium]